MSKRFTIVALGEVLWDVFPDGPRFGGAPANLACHAAAMGAEVFMVSQVGNDQLGEKAIEALREHGVNTDHIGRSDDHPTGTVKVELDAAGKPLFTITANVAWDRIPWSDQLLDLATRTDAVCFGTLAQRHDISRRTIQEFLAAVPPAALRVLDVNLRAPFFDHAVIERSLELANVFKLSDDELPVIAPMLGIDATESSTLAQLMQHYKLRLVALTRGKDGALLFDGKHSSQAQGQPVAVKDTVGAGDSFTAVLTLGILKGMSLDTINQRACEVAAYVCSQAGATPSLPEQYGDLDRIG
jgi:fructokinase